RVSASHRLLGPHGGRLLHFGWVRARAGEVMRKRSWTTWLAFRSLITGLVALVAAYMVDSAALPRLASESRGLEKTASVPAILGTIQPYLMHIPATAVGIALMAVMIRSLRGI